MGDDIISNAQPVKLLDEQDNPYGVQSNPVVVQFNGSVGIVSVTGTVPVTVPQPITVNGTVAVSTNPLPVTFDQSGTLNTVIRQQPVQVFGTVVATGVSVSVSVGTVAISTNPVPVSFTGTVPVVVTGGTMSVSNTGTALTVNISSQSPGIPHSWNGYVQTALASPTLEYACRPNAYTPQPNGAARSIKSTSGHDQFTAGGGAKTVKLTYYSQTGLGDLTGPFEETINLNGLVAVNTSGSDIRYIEDLVVYTAGTSGWNVGNLQIYTGTNGGGSVMATMSANDNQIYLGHHYVPSGYYCYIQDLQIAATAANNRIPYFDIHYKPLNLVNAAEQNILPFLKVTGFSGRSINFSSTHRVQGPGVITAYYTPTDNASQTGSIGVGCYETPVT